MGIKYSDDELNALCYMIGKNGHLKYINPYDVEVEFEQLTGKHRASGPLYMAAWRIEKGYYSHRGIDV